MELDKLIMIMDRYNAGTDCTEDESAHIKQFMVHVNFCLWRKELVEDEVIELYFQFRNKFIVEYAEVITELNRVYNIGEKMVTENENKFPQFNSAIIKIEPDNLDAVAEKILIELDNYAKTFEDGANYEFGLPIKKHGYFDVETKAMIDIIKDILKK